MSTMPLSPLSGKGKNRRNFFDGFDVVGLEKLLKDVQDGLTDSPMINKVHGGKFPYSDICVSPEGIMHIEIAAAGFAKEDFDISKEADLLIVKGTVSEESIKDDAGMKYYQKEIAKRAFVRKFALAPEYAESEQISATSENGILTISIWPVEKTKSKTTKISVE